MKDLSRGTDRQQPWEDAADTEKEHDFQEVPNYGNTEGSSESSLLPPAGWVLQRCGLVLLNQRQLNRLGKGSKREVK